MKLSVLIMSLALMAALTGCQIGPSDPINEVEPNDTITTAQAIPADGTIVNANATAMGNDYYSFEAAAGGSYQVEVTWVSGDNLILAMDWFGPDESHISSTEAAATRGSISQTIATPAAGDYYLLVFDANLSGGDYQLSVTKN